MEIPNEQWKDAVTSFLTIGFTWLDRFKILIGCDLVVRTATLCEIAPGRTKIWSERSDTYVLNPLWWPHEHKWKYVGGNAGQANSL